MSNQLHKNEEQIALDVFDSGNAGRKAIVKRILQAVTEGEVDPLKIHTQLKSMESVVKKIMEDKDYKREVLLEAEKYGKGTFAYRGHDVTVKNGAPEYDYSVCGSSKLDMLKEKFEQAKAELNAHIQFLTSLPSEGIEQVDTDTGESYHLYPPIKKVASIVSVTLK